jgi:hypothetical protein
MIWPSGRPLKTAGLILSPKHGQPAPESTLEAVGRTHLAFQDGFGQALAERVHGSGHAGEVDSPRQGGVDSGRAVSGRGESPVRIASLWVNDPLGRAD